MKKFLTLILSVCMVLCFGLMLTACFKRGPKGEKGETGAIGKSAYELAVENGYSGTEAEWLASLVGEPGKTGATGINGKSAYELAVEKGYQGTLDEWLESLIGENGQAGINGSDGKSAYELAVENGFDGSLDEWLASLVGEQGADGKDGNGIISIEKTATNDNIDTYTITFDDGSFTTFNITNGIDGEQGIQGIQVEQGIQGEQGVGIDSIVIDYTGLVVITLTDGSIYEIAVEDETCKHTNVEGVMVYPTCTERGYTKYICKDCGYIYINEYTPASGHHFSDRYCVFCETEEKFGEITPDISWYSSSVKNFELSNREQLAGLAYLVNINKVNFSGVTIKLANHIDLAGVEWIPIGNAEIAFAGTFDGQGLTISNLKISQQLSYVGLFGNVSGTIKRFNVSGANIAVASYDSYVAIACGYNTGSVSGISVGGYIDASNNSNVGGVLGYSTKGVIDCSSAAIVTGATYVGGIAGNIVSTESVTYDGLENTGNVTGVDYVGGIIGRFNLSVSNSSVGQTITVNECKNSGNITGENYVAGIIGYIYANNSHSYESAKVTATLLECVGEIKGVAYVGGIFGYGKSEAEGMISTSNVNAEISGEYNIGGIAGVLEVISIDSCSNDGSSITATGHITVDGQFYVRLGGYVGSGYKISNCTNNIDLTYTGLGMQVGGIAGYATSNITDCTNNGNITAKSYVGGIIGDVASSVSVTYDGLENTGDITGIDHIGGIIGKFWLSVSNSSVGQIITVNECRNSGNITGEKYVAGIIGHIYANNSHYHQTTRVTATLLANYGIIKGTSVVGGMIGYFYSEGASTLTEYTMEGTVFCNETETNDVVVAEQSNLTIS